LLGGLATDAAGHPEEAQSGENALGLHRFQSSVDYLGGGDTRGFMLGRRIRLAACASSAVSSAAACAGAAIANEVTPKTAAAIKDGRCFIVFLLCVMGLLMLESRDRW
jgi:hypothetical protein